MFIGHPAAAFAAKRIAPRVGLGTLFAAAIGLDLLWPFFTLAGIEHFRIDPGNTAFTPIDFYDYPWTHSMVTALACSTPPEGRLVSTLRPSGFAWLTRRRRLVSQVLGKLTC